MLMLSSNTRKLLAQVAVQTVILLILFWQTVVLSGCVPLLAVGAGVGVYGYIAGNITREYRVDYDSAVTASSLAMDQLQLTISDKTSDALKTTIHGKRADNSPVTIVVEKIENRKSRIGVRSGPVGIIDQDISMAIHNQITANLDKNVVSVTQAQTSNPTITADHKKKRYRTKTATKANGAATPKSISPSPSNSKEPSPPQQQVSKEVAEKPVLPGKSLYIFYDDKEVAVPARSHESLNSIADYLMQKPQTTIEVRSYTDSFGDATENLNLSSQRAEAIEDYLINRGVDSSRISAKGYGATNFLESNQTEKLRAINRRVELYIQASEQSIL